MLTRHLSVSLSFPFPHYCNCFTVLVCSFNLALSALLVRQQSAKLGQLSVSACGLPKGQPVAYLINIFSALINFINKLKASVCLATAMCNMPAQLIPATSTLALPLVLHISINYYCVVNACPGSSSRGSNLNAAMSPSCCLPHFNYT